MLMNLQIHKDIYIHGAFTIQKGSTVSNRKYETMHTNLQFKKGSSITELR